MCFANISNYNTSLSELIWPLIVKGLIATSGHQLFTIWKPKIVASAQETYVAQIHDFLSEDETEIVKNMTR